MRMGQSPCSSIFPLVVCVIACWLVTDTFAFVHPRHQATLSLSTGGSPTSPFHWEKDGVRCYYSLVNVPVEKTSTGSSSSSSEALFQQLTSSKSAYSNNNKSAASPVATIPFEIERLPEQPSETVYKEISQMCINAFFNDGVTGRRIPFWKDWQLAYLRTLQQTDLRIRRKRYPETNMMFIAREVVPVTNAAMVQKSPLVLDLQKVFNLTPEQQRGGTDFVQGQVLGFVEVTLRPYGLGSEQVGFDDDSRIQLRTNAMHKKRPVLTNLSVKYEARKSGVGSRLMERCESEILQTWPANKEIILEVESDNVNAFKFYQKRGFEKLFDDPAGRRYDTSGLMLRQLRCVRNVMRKDLAGGLRGMVVRSNALGGGSINGDVNYMDLATKAIQRLRSSLFPIQG